jgi:soluble lytic murein transglycosylase-like protein
MRVGAWGAVLLAALCSATAAGADIYRYRSPSGLTVYTNAPAERVSKLLIKERPIPPAPRMMIVKPGFKPAFIEQVPRVTGPLRGVAIAARAPVKGMVTPAVTVSASPTSYDELIREIAARYGVEYALVKAVIKAESDFNRLAVSSKGAQGLMQLMPATAAMHQVQNVFLPRDNIEGGCRHLRMLLDRYGGNLPLSIAAYNAGTRRVEEAGGVPPILETRQYLARVLRYRLAYLRENGVGLQASR